MLNHNVNVISSFFSMHRRQLRRTGRQHIFGFLLGAAGLGMLRGQPLEISHIAFSSAYSDFALVSLDFGVAW